MLILNSVNPDMYQNNTASKTKTKLHLYMKENSIDQKLFAKMHRDKNNFNIMDENYYFLLESLHKLNEEFKFEVESL